MFNNIRSVFFTTAGGGYWSGFEKTVEITNIKIGYCSEDKNFGELRVYFNPATWDISRHGLIYTDGKFLTELRLFLDSHGLPGSDVSYSEQGMQGDNYVSLDVEGFFLSSWALKFGEESLS